ncbi:MAG: hypothetical protein Q8K58_04440 [Acidimicrobiales bacterium]|nr:hypothetical protein [Acidimicrobiales bacterium]
MADRRRYPGHRRTRWLRQAYISAIALTVLTVALVPSVATTQRAHADEPTGQPTPPDAASLGPTVGDAAAVRARWRQLSASADAYGVRAGQQSGVIKVNLARAFTEATDSPLSHALASPVDVGAVQVLLGLALNLPFPVSSETLYPAGATDQSFDDTSPGAALNPLVPVAARSLYSEAHSRPAPSATAYTSYAGANTKDTSDLLKLASNAVVLAKGTAEVALGPVVGDAAQDISSLIDQLSVAAALLESVGDIVQVENVASRSDTVDTEDGKVRAEAVTELSGVTIAGVLKIDAILSRTVVTFDPARGADPYDPQQSTFIGGASVLGIPVNIDQNGINVAGAGLGVTPVVTSALSSALSQSGVLDVRITAPLIVRDETTGAVDATTGALRINFNPPKALSDLVNVLTPLEVALGETHVKLKAVPAPVAPSTPSAEAPSGGGQGSGTRQPVDSSVTARLPTTKPATSIEVTPTRPSASTSNTDATLPIGFSEVDEILLWLLVISGVSLLISIAQLWRWTTEGETGATLYSRAGAVLGERLVAGRTTLQ